MRETKICRYCGQEVDIDAKTCRYCKKDLCKEHDNPELFCKRCKAPVNTDDNFCQRCGAIFDIPEEVKPAKHNASGIPYNIGILFTSFAVSLAATVFYTSGKTSTFGENSLIYCLAFVVSEIFLYIYFLPSILAIEKNNPNAYLIYICNLLLGVTVIGWLITLIFTMKTNQDWYTSAGRVYRLACRLGETQQLMAWKDRLGFSCHCETD